MSNDNSKIPTRAGAAPSYSGRASGSPGDHTLGSPGTFSEAYRIFDSIGPAGTSTTDVMQAVEAGHRLFELHSEGGSAHTAAAIARVLTDAGSTIYCHGAASAAVAVLVAGRQRVIARNGWLLLHPPWRVLAGGAEQLRAAADQCDEVAKIIAQHIARHTFHSFDAALALVNTGAILDAEQALAQGFVDFIGEPSKRVAPKPTTAKDGPERELAMLHDRALAAEHRAAAERADADAKAANQAAPEMRTSFTRSTDQFLVEAFANPEVLASTFSIGYAQRMRQAKSEDADQQPAPAFWICHTCGTRNYAPPSINRRPTTCRYCPTTTKE